MQPYKNLSGKSGISEFEIGPSTIRVAFKNGDVYLYTDVSTSIEHILKMQQLALDGAGLSSYIRKYMREGYAMRTSGKP